MLNCFKALFKKTDFCSGVDQLLGVNEHLRVTPKPW